jgi:hypothetical protein
MGGFVPPSGLEVQVEEFTVTMRGNGLAETLEGHLTRDLVLVFIQNHIDTLTDIFSHRNLGTFVQKLKLIVLIFRDVNGGRNFFAIHFSFQSSVVEGKICS